LFSSSQAQAVYPKSFILRFRENPLSSRALLPMARMAANPDGRPVIVVRFGLCQKRVLTGVDKS
jgi:hypothetical protein